MVESKRVLSANACYPEELCEAEREFIHGRREQARSSKGVAKGRLRGKAIGVACSGGGIRSATFCLGFFQGLSKLCDRQGGPLHLLKHLDFLSTVSGGGYFGGFLGRLISRGPGEKATGIERAEEVLADSHSEELGWLREHGRYISPTGAGDSLVAVAVFLRNWLTLHVVLGAAFLLLFLAVNTLRSALWSWDGWAVYEAALADAAPRGLWWSPLIGLVAVLLVGTVLPLGWSYWLAQRDPTSARSHTPLMATAIIVLTGIFLFDLAYRFGISELRGWEIVVVPFVLLMVIATAFSLLGPLRNRKHGQVWFRMIALGVLGFVVFLLYWLTRTGLFQERVLGTFLHPGTLAAFGAFGLVLLVGLLGLAIAWRIEGLENTIRALKKAESESGRREPGIASLTRRQATLVLVGLVIGSVLVLLYLAWIVSDGKAISELSSEIAASGFAIGATVVGIGAALALVYWIVAMAFAMERSPGDPAPSVRNHLSIWLSRSCLVAGGVVVLCLVDSIGQTLWALQVTGGGKLIFGVLSSVVASAAGFATVARTLADMVASGGGGDKEPRFRVPWKVLAAAASLLLWGSLIVLYSTASHAVLWRAEAPSQSLGPAIARSWLPSPTTGVLRVEPDGLVKVERPGVEPEGPGALDEESAAGQLAAPRDLQGMLVILAVVGGLLCLVSMNLRFVNFSSHQSLYAARLTRAYLGASNPRRREAEGRQLSQSIEDDDVLFDTYYQPHAEGGPLHLVSVTINETIEGRSQIEQRDRKGLPMCLGPAGISAGLRHHARWKPEDGGSPGALEITWDKPDHTTRRWVEIDPIDPAGGGGGKFHFFCAKPEPGSGTLVERLTLGGWLSISGAAFSTGLGAKTSLGLSSLMAFINVRLGYWWDSGINPAERQDFSKRGLVNRLSRAFARFLPAHAYLLDEVLARFRGPNRRRWYLSDGGHFENTGAYELLRRRVPMIVVLDCGADPSYDFADLANLVRKARIDFGAEIRFFSQSEIDKHVDPDINKYFGTPAQIRRQARELEPEAQDEIFHGRSYSRKHAALAQVWFEGDPDDSPTTEILWIKPSMVGDEPIDLRNYHGANPSFPQETTADQFFDEAQWESYRKLGERIAERLFYDDPRPEESWTPLRWFERKRNLTTFINPAGTEPTREPDIKSQPP